MTHFGSTEDVEFQLTELSRRLDEWAVRARTQDRDAFIDSIREEVARAVSPEVQAAYFQTAPPEQVYAGLERYWRKLESDVTGS